MQNKFLKNKTKPISIKKQLTSDLVENLSFSGFQARKLGEAAKIWQEMLKEKKTLFGWEFLAPLCRLACVKLLHS